MDLAFGIESILRHNTDCSAPAESTGSIDIKQHISSDGDGLQSHKSISIDTETLPSVLMRSAFMAIPAESPTTVYCDRVSSKSLLPQLSSFSPRDLTHEITNNSQSPSLSANSSISSCILPFDGGDRFWNGRMASTRSWWSPINDWTSTMFVDETTGLGLQATRGDTGSSSDVEDGATLPSVSTCSHRRYELSQNLSGSQLSFTSSTSLGHVDENPRRPKTANTRTRPSDAGKVNYSCSIRLC